MEKELILEKGSYKVTIHSMRLGNSYNSIQILLFKANEYKLITCHRCEHFKGKIGEWLNIKILNNNNKLDNDSNYIVEDDVNNYSLRCDHIDIQDNYIPDIIKFNNNLFKTKISFGEANKLLQKYNNSNICIYSSYINVKNKNNIIKILTQKTNINENLHVFCYNPTFLSMHLFDSSLINEYQFICNNKYKILNSKGECIIACDEIDFKESKELRID